MITSAIVSPLALSQLYCLWCDGQGFNWTSQQSAKLFLQVFHITFPPMDLLITTQNCLLGNQITVTDEQTIVSE